MERQPFRVSHKALSPTEPANNVGAGSRRPPCELWPPTPSPVCTVMRALPEGSSAVSQDLRDIRFLYYRDTCQFHQTSDKTRSVSIPNSSNSHPASPGGETASAGCMFEDYKACPSTGQHQDYHAAWKRLFLGVEQTRI
ncbi:hypothetical protein SKAU_G00380460 [Synaphobranchus kaupii]|uniref:Uncharacterized protein n=1 Tax=Synaphobranchus kaupii TaxID=118154 RepID=A0A9Q1IEM6_SYNKA|nr:hypothetical protein SKAU_G00380460 [Synaphobranchus kaupii]